MFSLICDWLNGWVNHGEASDLRRHGAHYDVIVMVTLEFMAKIGQYHIASKHDEVRTMTKKQCIYDFDSDNGFETEDTWSFFNK